MVYYGFKGACLSLCLDEITQWPCLVSLDHGLRGNLSEASVVCTCPRPTGGQHGPAVSVRPASNNTEARGCQGLLSFFLQQLPLSNLYLEQKVKEDHSQMI